MFLTCQFIGKSLTHLSTDFHYIWYNGSQCIYLMTETGEVLALTVFEVINPVTFISSVRKKYFSSRPIFHGLSAVKWGNSCWPVISCIHWKTRSIRDSKTTRHIISSPPVSCDLQFIFPLSTYLLSLPVNKNRISIDLRLAEKSGKESSGECSVNFKWNFKHCRTIIDNFGALVTYAWNSRKLGTGDVFRGSSDFCRLPLFVNLEC